MRKILGKKFFERNVVTVAEDLIGKFLVRNINGKEIALMITETEAYDGEKDLACHASKGRTKRCEVLYDEAGKLYVYLIYGMHHMLNVVTGKREYPAAVLIRGVQEISGPGRLTRKMAIKKDFHGKEASKMSGLWFEDRGVKIRKKYILRTPRIGVAYAGPVWSKKPWRFVHMEGNRKAPARKKPEP